MCIRDRVSTLRAALPDSQLEVRDIAGQEVEDEVLDSEVSANVGASVGHTTPHIKFHVIVRTRVCDRCISTRLL